MRKTQGFALLLALSACATQQTSWQKPGASQADMTTALNSCTSEATQKYPVDMEQVQITQGYNTSPGTGCGYTPSSGTQTCESAGAYVQPQTRMADTNKNARDKEIAACMRGQGWSGG